MSDLGPFAAVALTEDAPSLGLRRGQMGTIVHKLGEDIYEVEFSGEDGEAYAIATLEGSKLMRLHRRPASDAAA